MGNKKSRRYCVGCGGGADPLVRRSREADHRTGPRKPSRAGPRGRTL